MSECKCDYFHDRMAQVGMTNYKLQLAPHSPHTRPLDKTSDAPETRHTAQTKHKRKSTGRHRPPHGDTEHEEMYASSAREAARALLRSGPTFAPARSSQSGSEVPRRCTRSARLASAERAESVTSALLAPRRVQDPQSLPPHADATRPCKQRRIPWDDAC